MGPARAPGAVGRVRAGRGSGGPVGQHQTIRGHSGDVQLGLSALHTQPAQFRRRNTGIRHGLFVCCA